MTEMIPGTSTAAAFPLGGIGTGTVSLGARGELRDWEVENHPDKGRRLPFTFFAIHVDGPDGGIARVLEAQLPGPHTGDEGYAATAVAGLPRLRSSRMRGEYPLAEIAFDDERLPVMVSLEAFTPFVPLDADASGLPVAVLRYSVTNTSAHPVTVTVAGSMSNPIGQLPGHWAGFTGDPSVRWRDDGRLRGLDFGTSLPEDDPRFGSVALVTTDSSVSAKPRWLTDNWNDGVQSFWDEFRSTGRLTPESRLTLDDVLPRLILSERRPVADEDLRNRLIVGSLAVTRALAPGESHVFEFVLAWSFPRRPRGWNGHVFPQGFHTTKLMRNHYATRFDDAWAAADHLITELPRLEADTRAFHDALFGSTLDPAIVDAAASTLATLRSTTCFRGEDGAFAGWEGSFDHAGSCEGTCTHVWNYAQSVAYLFPELERGARRNEFLRETDETGLMQFRTNRVFGGHGWGARPAADGQLGTIIRLFREWRFCGDDAFLGELWPAAVRAMEYAIREWDDDQDGVLDNEQHNTYDIEFIGENPHVNSLFYAALRAAAEMADGMGEPQRAARYRVLAATGAEKMDRLLFNGEYYQQRVDDVDRTRYQFGAGVLSDQLLGQWMAHTVGLGHLLPSEHVRSAVAAIHAHNFIPSLENHESTQRTFALNNEGGLLLCSWPRGGRPRIPFIYSDEVWTGIEYQVAAHLVYEGLPEPALEIVRAARSRHDGTVRSPWNDVECGNHYARALSAWSLVLAFSGAQWDARTRSLAFDPAQDGPFRSVFTTGTGWGEVEITPDNARLRLHGGVLELDELVVRGEILRSTPCRLEAGSVLDTPR